MQSSDAHMSTLGLLLKTNKVAKTSELLAVFFGAFALIRIATPFIGENSLWHQVVVWFANVLMLGLIWLGLRLRGQVWGHFGLSFRFSNRRSVISTFLRSLLAFIAGMAAFILGSIIMANIVGIPESSDMSGYHYLRGNLTMLILALVGVYIASSMGEEIIYRGFLINRLAELGSGGKTPLRLAVIISAIVFGLVHFEWGLMGIVQTGFMGLALGIVYILMGRNLWVLILAHAYMDTILLVQQYLSAN